MFHATKDEEMSKNMKRIHLFEFMDQTWYPKLFRRMQTDYLQFVVTQGSAHKKLAPLIKKTMQQAGTQGIVDLCSGGTGPWLKLHQHLTAEDWPVQIKLTDKYPDPESVQRWPSRPDTHIEYLAESVDATKVPSHLTGMRTLFEGLHHFNPKQAKAILQDAVEQKTAIGVFEAELKRPKLVWLLLSPLMTLLGYIVVTPFLRPRTFGRFFWTYLIPVVPLVTCWDGIISFLRVYSPQALKEITNQIQCDGYTWEIGQAATGTPLFVYTYLLGYPAVVDE